MRALFPFLAFGAAVPAFSAEPGLHNIGSRRQFFFDDAIVERLENTRPRLNPAVKVQPNPILGRGKPWESADTTLSWVFFDQALGKFRLRYTTGVLSAVGRNEKGEVAVRGEEPGARVTCEAYSEDGVHWQKPELGLVDYKGSRANNLLPAEYTRVEYCFQDLHDRDPARRYKGFVRKGDVKTPGMTVDLYYSPDSYHWTAHAGNPVVNNGAHVGRWGPTFFQGWDPIRETYFAHMENNLHMNSPWRRRSIGRAESRDLISWSEPETIVVTDDQDYPDTEFYALPASYHEGWLLGVLWIFSTTNTNYYPQFVFSRDGVRYDRRYRDPLVFRGDAGDFDSVVLIPQAPIVHRDEVLIFYDGSNWRSPEQLLELGDRAQNAIGLAKLPLDGFVSLEGARLEPSVVTTRSFTFSGSSLHLNVQAAIQQWGAGPCEVRVEVLNSRHQPVPGYTLADADVITATDVRRKVSWQGRTDVSSLAGKPVRLRIQFKNAKLYTFQFR